MTGKDESAAKRHKPDNSGTTTTATTVQLPQVATVNSIQPPQTMATASHAAPCLSPKPS